MAADDLLILPTMRDLASALEDQLQCFPNPPAVVSMRPGDTITLMMSQYDNECCSGLGWVRCVTFYPTAATGNFPSQDVDYRSCAPQAWAMVLELGVARCAPTPDHNSIPSADDWNAAVEAQMRDASAMRRAISLFKQLPDYEDTPWVVGVWTPQTVEGGCLGGTIQVTIQAPTCREDPCT